VRPQSCPVPETCPVHDDRGPSVALGCVSRVGVGDDPPSGPVVGSVVALPGTPVLVGAAMLVGDGVSADVGGRGLAVPATGAMVPGTEVVAALTVSPGSTGDPSGTGVLVGTRAMPGAAVVVKVGLSVLAGAGGGCSRREMNVLVVQARRPAIMATTAIRTAHCFLVFVLTPPHALVGLGTQRCVGPAWPPVQLSWPVAPPAPPTGRKCAAAPGFHRRMPLYPRRRHGANPHRPPVTAVPEYLSDRATPTADAGSRWRARDAQAVREGIREKWDSSAALPLLWSSLRITCGESSRCTLQRLGFAAGGNLSSRCRASRPAHQEGRSARVRDELLGPPCPRWNRVLWRRRCCNPLRTPPSGKGQVVEKRVGATQKAGQSSPAFRIP
jgi:hypothetical protein